MSEAKFKPVGAHVILRLEEAKSSIHLIEGSSARDQDREITVVAVGSECVLGLKAGDSVITAAEASAIPLEKTEEHTLILVPEHVVKAIKV